MQDLFTLNHTTSYLKNALIGAKINKALEPSTDEINLVLFNGKSFRLIISINAKFSRVSISNTEKQTLDVAPNFLMLLRKYLVGGEITGVEIVNNDRIIKISVENQSNFLDTQNFELYAEIMGKYSNLFLTKSGVILGALKQTPQELDCKRVLVIGSKYTYPEKQGKISCYDDSAKEVFDSASEITPSFLLQNFYEFSPTTASEIAYRINTQQKPRFEVFKEFISLTATPTVIDSGVKKDFYATDYLSLSGKRTTYENMCDAMEEVFSLQEKQNQINSQKHSLVSAVNSYEKRLVKRYQSNADRILGAKDYEDYKLLGELITYNLYLVKKGDKKVVLTNYTDNGEEQVEVILDENLTPQQNAQKYFKAYHKKKNTVTEFEKQQTIISKELEYVKSIKYHLENAVTPDEIAEIKEELISSKILKSNDKNKKKQQVKSKFLKYKVLGFTVFVGKNNIQNDKLLSEADRNDIWLHTKNYHSSFVIIKTEGKEVEDTVIEKCAEICAHYSEAKGGGKIEVDYTYKRFVKKNPNGNLGSVFYTDQKTIVVSSNQNKDLEIL